MQQMVGGFLTRNWTMIPHVTHNDDADVTAMEAFRKQLAVDKGVRVTGLVFVVKAVVAALRKYPQFNASLDASGHGLVLKKYFHIGIAVDTPGGLLVPVLRDCDKTSVVELANEIAAISEKARTKGLSTPEMSGGCISISALGAFGGTSFSPIINAPEVAILGVTRTREVPVRDGDSLAWRQMLPLSLSYDHRVINGADAARFTRCIAEHLADPRALTNV